MINPQSTFSECLLLQVFLPHKPKHVDQPSWKQSSHVMNHVSTTGSHAFTGAAVLLPEDVPTWIPLPRMRAASLASLDPHTRETR